MKKLALSLVLLLSVFPAFGARPQPKAAPDEVASKCASIEKIKAAVIKGKLDAELAGDDLKRFNDNYARLTKTNAPEGIDRILVFRAPNSPILLMVVFAKGCAVGMQPIQEDLLKKLTGPLIEDGSI